MGSSSPARSGWIAIAVLVAAVVLTTGGGAARAAVGRQATFPITGDVSGLYPGATLTLDAHINNPFAFMITVSALHVTAADANAGCPSGLLTIGSSPASTQIAAGATVTVPLSVRLAASASDACQKATFPLKFSARASAVTSTATSSPRGFAFTGDNIAVLVVVGLALLAVGLIIRRRARKVAA